MQVVEKCRYITNLYQFCAWTLFMSYIHDTKVIIRRDSQLHNPSCSATCAGHSNRSQKFCLHIISIDFALRRTQHGHTDLVTLIKSMQMGINSPCIHVLVVSTMRKIRWNVWWSHGETYTGSGREGTRWLEQPKNKDVTWTSGDGQAVKLCFMECWSL